jgi:hypothetical protein
MADPHPRMGRHECRTGPGGWGKKGRQQGIPAAFPEFFLNPFVVRHETGHDRRGSDKEPVPAHFLTQ